MEAEQRGDGRLAERLWMEVLRSAEQTQNNGSDDSALPVVAQCLAGLGRLAFGNGRPREALVFLDRARPPAGVQPVAISDAIEHVREMAWPRLSRSGITLSVNVTPGLPLIRADVTQLEMAVLNLVTNAIDAMPGGGALTISASPFGDGVRLCVADTGPGIAEDVLNRLFDPWVTTKPAGQGSGLGLAIVRDVVRASGGSVSAVNSTVGAVFTIHLLSAQMSEGQHSL